MTMTHEQIDAADVIDRYVRGDLDAATSDAFEEHYFECDTCFARVQELESLRGAVRDAVATGALNDEAPAMAHPAAVLPGRTARSTPIMTWLPLAATLALVTGLFWRSAYVQMPALRTELSTISAERDQLKGALDAAKAAPVAPVTPVAAIEANLPMVTLASERAVGDTPVVQVAADAAHFLVVIDGPPSPNGRGALAIVTGSGAPITSVRGLIRDANGVWTVNLPAASFPAGVYRFRLSADVPNGTLLGEYLLRVTK